MFCKFLPQKLHIIFDQTMTGLGQYTAEVIRGNYLPVGHWCAMLMEVSHYNGRRIGVGGEGSNILPTADLDAVSVENELCADVDGLRDGLTEFIYNRDRVFGGGAYG